MYKNRSEDGRCNLCGRRIAQLRGRMEPHTSQRALADKMPDCDKLLPLLRSEPENMERLLDFFRESGLDGRLAESGFSAEEQRRLRERMIQ